MVLQIIKNERIEQKKKGREATFFLLFFFVQKWEKGLHEYQHVMQHAYLRRWIQIRVCGIIWLVAACAPHKTLHEEARRIPLRLPARGGGAAPVWVLSAAYEGVRGVSRCSRAPELAGLSTHSRRARLPRPLRELSPSQFKYIYTEHYQPSPYYAMLIQKNNPRGG